MALRRYKPCATAEGTVRFFAAVGLHLCTYCTERPETSNDRNTCTALHSARRVAAGGESGVPQGSVLNLRAPRALYVQRALGWEGVGGTAQCKGCKTKQTCAQPACPEAPLPSGASVRHLCRIARWIFCQKERCADAMVRMRCVPPPPPCISYALVQATVGVGTVIIAYVILIAYEM